MRLRSSVMNSRVQRREKRVAAIEEAKARLEAVQRAIVMVLCGK